MSDDKPDERVDPGISPEWLGSKLESGLDTVVRSATANAIICTAFLLCVINDWPLDLGLAGINIGREQGWVLTVAITGFYVHGCLALGRLHKMVVEYTRSRQAPKIEMLRQTVVLHSWMVNPFVKRVRAETFREGLLRNSGILLMVTFHHIDILVAAWSWGCCKWGQPRSESWFWISSVVIAAAYFFMATKATSYINGVSRILSLDYVEGMDGPMGVLALNKYRSFSDTSPWRARLLTLGWIPGAVALGVGLAFLKVWSA